MTLVQDSPPDLPPGAPSGDDAPLPVAAEYGFLLGPHLDRETLADAYRVAERWGVYPHEVLIASGRISEATYVGALGRSAGVPFRTKIATCNVAVPGTATLRQCLKTPILEEIAPVRRFLLGLDRLRPFDVRTLLAGLAQHPVALACPSELRRATRDHFSSGLVHDAVHVLASRRPHLSARRPATPWQVSAFVLGCAAIAIAALTAPMAAVYTVSIVLACLFVPVIVFRLLAATMLARAGPHSQERDDDSTPDSQLPTYTILAPLYREAHMVEALLRALSRLDWPTAKLDIKLVLEEADAGTIAAARALSLPANVEIVIVPDRAPRTKPKALNYALPLARGDYLVVYDAEDRPEPDQLRRAHEAFRLGPSNLATVQARLNIYNPDANWLTRQFTIEYSALFDGLLPLLDRLRLPIPLGGTSNHFRVAALKWLLAWDPYNVTEDADLGTRLARSGYRCAVIGSTTYEEAPARLGSWIPQRTRWLKGFIQTWLVHMRAPRALLRELGLRGFLAFHIMIGGTILSALVHPWFYGLVAVELGGSQFLALPRSVLGVPFWAVSLFSLVAGYGAAMALGLFALRRRGLHRLVWQVPLMPLYWLLISVAAYRALFQFAVAPFKWEKTDHGAAASVARPAYSCRPGRPPAV